MILVDGEFFLCKEEGINGGVEFLAEYMKRLNGVIGIEMRVVFLDIEFIQAFQDFGF